MAGSMRERTPGVWELRVYLGRDPVTGHPKQKSMTFRGGKRDAGRALAAMVANSGRAQLSTEATVAHLLTRHLDHLERRGAAHNTLKNRQSAVKNHILPELGDVPLKKLTAERLDALYDSKLDDGYAPGSVNNLHGILSSALKQAVRWGWIEKNPAEHAAPPARRYKEYPLPTIDDLRTLIAGAAERDPVIAVLFFLAVTTGARRAELCGLQWADVDFGAGTLYVLRNVKTKKPRRVSLDDASLAALSYHRVATAEAIARDPAGTDWLFSHDGGATPLSPATVTQWLVYHRTRLGLSPFRLHDLRHASVTTLLTEGIDPRTVAGRHGHDPRVMIGRYAHFLEPADRRAADIMGRLGLPSPGGRTDKPRPGGKPLGHSNVYKDSEQEG